MKVSMSEKEPAWLETYFIGRCSKCGNKLYRINEKLVTITGRSICRFPLRAFSECYTHEHPHVLRDW